MARAPEPDVRITEGVQPAAGIYDTYVRPATPAPSPLHEVASALAPLSSELFSLSNQQRDEQAKKDLAAGQAAFWSDNQDGAAEGVATGKIPAQASPKFMDGYAGMAAIHDAAVINQSIGPDYTSLDKTTADPQAFDKWFFPYVKSKANPALVNNPAYAHAWAASVAQLHGSLSAKYVQDRSDALKSGAFQSFSGSLGNAIDEQYYGSGGSPDTIKLGETVQGIRSIATQSGLEKAQVDKAVIDVVATKALETKNPALLDVLNTIPADPKNPTGVKLGETEYGNATRVKLQQSIQTRLLQDRERAQKETDRQDKEQGNATLSDVLTQWSKDAHYIPTEAQIAKINKVHPEFRASMAKLRENLLSNDTVEDPQAKTTLFEDIFHSGDPQTQIDKAIRTGVLKTPGSIDEAVKFGNLVENYNKTGGSFKITQDPSFKSLEQAIITHTKDPKLFGSMFAEQGLTDAGRSALYDARLTAMQWSSQHANAGAMERAEFLFKLQEGILKKITPPPTAGAVGDEFKPSYTPAPGAPSTQAQPPVAPQAPSGGPPVTPSQAPVVPQPTQGNNAPAAAPGGTALLDAIRSSPTSPTVETLGTLGVTPELVQQFRDAATRAGQDPNAILKKFWDQRAAPGKQGAVEGGSHLQEANQAMGLTPQEQALYQRHLTNLSGSGGVDNPDGSRSTLFQASVEHDGKVYNIPTVWEGKILPVPEAVRRVEAEGWDKFPSYANEAAAEARYQQMHSFMEKDTQDYFARKNRQGSLEGGSQAQPVSLTLPGGGRVDLHGLTPEVQAQVTQMVQRVARLATSPTPQASGDIPDSTSASPHNADIAMRFFASKGLSPADAAAMVWNFQQESGRDINPTLIHDGGTGYGIAGYRDPHPGSGRKSNLFAFAGTTHPSLLQQLEFAWHELNGPERGTLSRILAAGTPEEKAKAAIGYFRPRAEYAAHRAREAGGVLRLLSHMASNE